MKSQAFWVGVLSGIVAAVLVGLFAVPALGLFEMTATGDPGLLDWWGDTNWHNSLRWRATEADIPAAADPSQGLEHYKATCLHCHGAPDASRAEWAHHMRPRPPKLWENETQQMSDGELFHIVQGGVRMTGMPAFGPKHSDEEIWSMVAFVRQLNDLSDEQKQQLKKAASQNQHRHGSGKHGHGSHSDANSSSAAGEETSIEPEPDARQEAAHGGHEHRSERP